MIGKENFPSNSSGKIAPWGDFAILHFMYDDEELAFDDDEFDEYSDEINPYQKKGSDDRAFVDQQAKDYDEERRKKRAEFVKLHQRLLALRSEISRRERELRDLGVEIEKEDYRETKERVIAERTGSVQGERAPQGITSSNHDTLMASGLEISGTDVEEEVMTLEMQKRMERESCRRKRTDLEKEILELVGKANAIAREVSILEHALMRT